VWADAWPAPGQHPAMPWVLSVAEDGYVNVWNLENIGSQVMRGVKGMLLRGLVAACYSVV
jgi:hypothetical protein